uniref:Uncharacterized protein n=1 Tax=Cacopsylla melanoneura TaxID=428564 RepID=A0A8D9B8J8_9HEMI
MLHSIHTCNSMFSTRILSWDLQHGPVMSNVKNYFSDNIKNVPCTITFFDYKYLVCKKNVSIVVRRIQISSGTLEAASQSLVNPLILCMSRHSCMLICVQRVSQQMQCVVTLLTY